MVTERPEQCLGRPRAGPQRYQGKARSGQVKSGVWSDQVRSGQVLGRVTSDVMSRQVKSGVMSGHVSCQVSQV